MPVGALGSEDRCELPFKPAARSADFVDFAKDAPSNNLVKVIKFGTELDQRPPRHCLGLHKEANNQLAQYRLAFISHAGNISYTSILVYPVAGSCSDVERRDGLPHCERARTNPNRLAWQFYRRRCTSFIRSDYRDELMVDRRAACYLSERNGWNEMVAQWGGDYGQIWTSCGQVSEKCDATNEAWHATIGKGRQRRRRKKSRAGRCHRTVRGAQERRKGSKENIVTISNFSLWPGFLCPTHVWRFEAFGRS